MQYLKSEINDLVYSNTEKDMIKLEFDFDRKNTRSVAVNNDEKSCIHIARPQSHRVQPLDSDISV